MKFLNIAFSQSIFRISRVFKGIFFVLFTVLFVFFAYAKYDPPSDYADYIETSDQASSELSEVSDVALADDNDISAKTDQHIALTLSAFSRNMSRFDDPLNGVSIESKRSIAASEEESDASVNEEAPESAPESTPQPQPESEPQTPPTVQEQPPANQSSSSSVEPKPEASAPVEEETSETEDQTETPSENVVTTMSGEQYVYTKAINMTATAYTYSNNELDITASGRPVQVGVVSADFSVIPMNTKVYIVAADGSWEYGYAIVGDTGVRGNTIDIFLETYDECINFGIRDAIVYILE